MAVAKISELGTAGHGGTAQATDVITLTAAASIGDFIVLEGESHGQIISSVTDSKGNTWAVDKTQDNAGSVTVSIAHCAVTVALAIGDTVTVTWAASVTGAAVTAASYSGITGGTLDQSSGGTGSVVGWTTPSVTTTAAGELLVSVVAVAAGGSTETNTPTSPWVSDTKSIATDGNRGVFPQHDFEDAGTYAGGGTLGTAETWASVLVAYKPSGPPPPATSWGLWGLVSIILPWVTTHNYTQAVTETVGAAVDAVTRVFAGARSVIETVGPASDTVTRQAAYVRGITETVGAATDTVTRVYSAQRAPSETVGPGSDSVQRAATASRTVTEALTAATDAISRAVAFSRSLAESVGPATDSVARVRGTVRNPSETVGPATDTVTKVYVIGRNAAETVGPAADTVTRQITATRALSESVGPAVDTVSRVPALRRSIIEVAGAVSDYQTLIVGRGPVGYWRLDDTGTTAADFSGHGNPGTIAGGVTKSVPGLTADGDTAMSFDGVNGKVDVPYNAILNPPTTWSVEAWWNAPAQLSNCPLLDCRPASSGALAAGFDLFLNVGAGIGISVCSTNVAQTIITATTVMGARHHAVATYDGASVRLYVDGVLRAGPTACPYTPNPTMATAIGHLTSGANWVAGVIDEVVIYDIVLTAAEVSAHWFTGIAAAVPGATDTVTDLKVTNRNVAETVGPATDTVTRVPTPVVRAIVEAAGAATSYAPLVLGKSPVAYYRLDDSSTTVVDATGNGHTGTASAGVTLGQPGAIADGDTAMLFTGANGGRIDIPDAADTRFAGTSPFGLGIWVNPTFVGINAFPRLFSKEHFSPNRFGILLFLNDAGSGISVGGNRFNQGAFLGGASTPAGSIVAGQWHHILWTYDGVKHRIYINGVLRAGPSVDDTGSLDSTTDPWAIGTFTGGSAYLTGLMDEPAWFNYAPSARDASDLYFAGRTGAIPGAVDTVTRLAAYTRGLAETVGPALDSVFDLKAKFINAIETVGPAADVVTRVASVARAVAETVGPATATPSRIVAFARTVGETVGAATDAVARGVGRLRTITETVGAAADVVTRGFSRSRTVIESVGPATDTVTKAQLYTRLLAETMVVTDVVTRRTAPRRAMVESVGPAIDMVNAVTAHPFVILEPLVVTSAQPLLFVLGEDATVHVSSASGKLPVSSEDAKLRITSAQSAFELASD